MTYNLYIGSNNQTKKLELNKIKSILNTRHQGYTIYPVTGAWNGEEEHTALVTIEDDTAKIMETMNILKTELNQEAIGYQQVPELQYA